MHYHRYVLLPFLAFGAPLWRVAAQEPTLTLAAARTRAQQASPDVVAAREAVAVARGLERQAGAFANPVVSYGREATGDRSQSTSQDIVAADQQVVWPGIRSARRDAARARRTAAEARLAYVERQIAFEVARAFALTLAAERRARLADTVAAAFATAAAVSERRLREGDISGFAARRIRLEAARYSALRADAVLQQRTSIIALAALLGDSIGANRVTPLAEPPAIIPVSLSSDSLVALALNTRRDLDAAALDVEAARAEARRASSERMPPMSLTVGTKREEALGGASASGFVAGIALPLPLWDRRAGAVDAANAETRRRAAELRAFRRRVRREVMEAADALRAAQEQLQALGPAVLSDAAAALRSAQTAYAEGEITLLEWLDTVRAYQETESTIANLRAEVLIRGAALERAVGSQLFQELR
jgi:cobalt-zinc-cadmium efflux system outer membrane protein